MPYTSLQNKYIHIYQNFIHNKDQVISLPIINKWCSYIKNTSNGIHIFSTSALRMYISFQKKEGVCDGSILYFHTKKGRTQKKQKIINHPKLKIDFLIEINIEIIDYRDDILIYLNNFITTYIIPGEKELNKSKNTQTIQQKEQECLILNLLKQEKIGLSTIYKTNINTEYKELNSTIEPKENMRRQLIFYTNNMTKNNKITNTGSTILNFIKQGSKQKHTTLGKIKVNFEYQLQETKNYISYRLLTGFIHSLQEAGPKKIFQNFNKQQLLFSQIIKIDNQIEHSIIQHNNNCFSVLIPRYIGKAAEQEFIEQIEKQQKAHYIITQKSIFQKQKGMQREHNPNQGIYSNIYCSKTYCLQKSTGETIFGKQEILLRGKDSDIILNTIENKIYIGGKKLNTKQLHSQTMTIELLSKLIKQPDQLIHNKDLKPSSYSKNKNDMNSKIIIPFKKIIQEKLGKELQLTCVGQLHDFFVEMNLQTINMATIKHNTQDNY